MVPAPKVGFIKNTMIKVKLLSENAILPTRANPTDAGLDLYSAQDVGYYSYNNTIKVPTNIAIAIPPGYVGLIRDRSSVSLTGLKVTAGVIDSGYHGDIQVVFINTNEGHGIIEKGQKIAQILILPVLTPTPYAVKELDVTPRDQKGFGSSDNGST